MNDDAVEVENDDSILLVVITIELLLAKVADSTRKASPPDEATLVSVISRALLPVKLTGLHKRKQFPNVVNMVEFLKASTLLYEIIVGATPEARNGIIC